MKKVLILSLLFLFANSYNVKIKDSNVVLIVNGIEKEFEVNETLSLKGGDKICFKKGEGRVVIISKGYKKQLSKYTSKCKIMPTLNKQSSNNLNFVKENFQESKEESVSGVSLRSFEDENLSDEELINLQ